MFPASRPDPAPELEERYDPFYRPCLLWGGAVLVGYAILRPLEWRLFVALGNHMLDLCVPFLLLSLHLPWASRILEDHALGPSDKVNQLVDAALEHRRAAREERDQ